MKNILAAVMVMGAVAGCAREDNAGYDSGSAPATESGTITDNSQIPGPNYGSGAGMTAGETAPQGEQSGAGASAAASGGEAGPASAQAATANEEDAQGGASVAPAATGKRRASTNELGDVDGSPAQNSAPNR